MSNVIRFRYGRRHNRLMPRTPIAARLCAANAQIGKLRAMLIAALSLSVAAIAVAAYTLYMALPGGAA